MLSNTLYVFSISHYCEKARWALDLCDVDYDLKVLIPATYAKTTKELGLPASSVPILQTANGETLQGSSNIVVWANSQNQRLQINDETKAIEERANDILGIHTRRWFYSEALMDCPETVRPVFAHGASLIDKFILRLAWSKVVPVMIKRMDLGVAQESESRELVLAELNYFETLLRANSSSSEFLIGDRLSNADIALASLIAPLFNPVQHPLTGIFRAPARLAATIATWRGSALEKWLFSCYKNHRK